jgi:hypothetical protein
MKTYINNGSKKGGRAYLVVKGKRVYTGEEFEATDKDITSLSKDFNVKPKHDKPKAVETPQPDPIKTKSLELEKTLYGSETKNTNSVKGVK